VVAGCTLGTAHLADGSCAEQSIVVDWTAMILDEEMLNVAMISRTIFSVESGVGMGPTVAILVGYLPSVVHRDV
jgi:hypothetical protein